MTIMMMPNMLVSPGANVGDSDDHYDGNDFDNDVDSYTNNDNDVDIFTSTCRDRQE